MGVTAQARGAFLANRSERWRGSTMRTENVLDEFERERTGNHSCQSGTTGCPVGPYQAGVVRRLEPCAVKFASRRTSTSRFRKSWWLRSQGSRKSAPALV